MNLIRSFVSWVGLDSDVDVSEVNVSIGESALIQTDWKARPFAITVLDCAEVVDDATVRLPIRITAVAFRWAFAEEGIDIGHLKIEPDESGDVHVWWPAVSSDGDVFREFEDTILAMGGSREGFIYFRADEDAPDKSVPDQPFVQFEYFNDEAGCFVQVDLTRKVPTWAPILFKDGVRLGDVPVEGVSERLASFDITWAKGDQVPANQIGDTVALTSVRGDPWADLTVLGQPELVYETTARICLRVTSRAGKETSLARLGLELSTAPDTSGRIRHIWEETSVDDDGVALPDSFANVTLARSEAYEAYAYFRAHDGEDGSPHDPFVTLWYLRSGFWVPIDVARRE